VNYLGPWQLPPRRVVLWYVVSALPLRMVVALGAFLSYHYHALSIQSRGREDRAYEVIDTVHRVVLALARASIAERNFVILGDERSLSPLQAASSDVVDYARLRKLLTDSPEQLARLETLRQRAAAAWPGCWPVCASGVGFCTAASASSAPRQTTRRSV
jgi:CHASE3 domain sensor protein